MWYTLILLYTVLYVSINSDCGVQGLSAKVMKEAGDVVEKRGLNKGQHTDIQVAKAHWSQELDGVKTRVNTAHIRRKRNADTLTHLHLETDTKQFDIELHHARSVISQDTEVERTAGNISIPWHGRIPECYMTGHMKNNIDNTASISFCSHLMGSFTDDGRTYWMEFISDNHTDDSSVEHIVIAAGKDLVGSLSDGITAPDDRTQPKSAGYTMTDLPTPPYEKLRCEMALFVDSFYSAYAEGIGFGGEEKMIELLSIKLNGMAAEWGRADRLKYDVTLELKKLVFWVKDPDYFVWVKGSADKTLQNPCLAMQGLPYDYIMVLTGKSMSELQLNVMGIAFYQGTCKPKLRCGLLDKIEIQQYRTFAHEFGHNQPVTKCLREKNVNKPIAVEIFEELPGMTYTEDEICAIRFGPEYNRPWYIRAKRGICKKPHLCINVNESSVNYGIPKQVKYPIGGLWCGKGKVCSPTPDAKKEFHCWTYKEFGLDPALFQVKEGGWGAWGPTTTKCSRTCGTGFTYRRRKCDNPRPKNVDGPCKGISVEATMCNTDPCPGDPSDPEELIIKRAGENCAHVKKHKLYPWWPKWITHFKETGKKHPDYECSVLCDASFLRGTDGWWPDGIMPNGPRVP